MNAAPPLTLLRPGDAFPPLTAAWPPGSPAPGLVAAGGVLDVPTLLAAYRRGIFPWFSEGEPLLWWSPDPRMVLRTDRFRVHRSLRKTLQRFQARDDCEIRVDTCFADVMRACAAAPRNGQSGTWIGPGMLDAYSQLHAAGYAHSVETWVQGKLVAGLYGVCIGRAVFGESMFTHVTDGSKIALAALVGFCRAHGIAFIDCQQDTRHLSSLGATPVPRAQFVQTLSVLCDQPSPDWNFEPVYWTFV